MLPNEEKRKTRVGTVISDKMDKTVVVRVESLRSHPIYHRTTRHWVKFKAHNENNEARLGDKVRIVETRPLSREKRWRVAEIVIRAEVAEIQPADIT